MPSAQEAHFLAIIIAHRILAETGEMYRVWVNQAGEIEIPLPINAPWKKIKEAVETLKSSKLDIKWQRSSFTLHFTVEKTP